MGPLVPDIISNEFNLVVAFILGMAFGWVLEQAGFSSTRKLVGLFYGYDFTVLRVFFTAGVTAMIGILLLNHIGLLDTSLIYINPTFLWSGIIGGVIMGAGFIIGGFCPGTSVCAAAIGKLDAMAFVIGSVLGIFVFTEGYPHFKEIYLAENWGAVRAEDFFGISSVMLAIIITSVAVLAFIVTSVIENNINQVPHNFSKSVIIRNALAIALPFILLAVIAITPERRQIILHKISDKRQQQKCIFREIPADKLAEEIVNRHYELNIIDVRSPEEYNKYHLPLAVNVPIDSMFNREFKSLFRQKLRQNIFYSDNDTTTRKACLLAKYLGYSDNYILRETVHEFRELFSNLPAVTGHLTKKEADLYRFRTNAAKQMQDLVNSLKNTNQPVRKKNVRIKGGCS